MEYFLFVVIGLAVGVVVGRFLTGNNFGMQGDILFGITGALVGGIALGASGLVPEGGTNGRLVMAVMGAFIALFVRRVVKVV